MILEKPNESEFQRKNDKTAERAAVNGRKSQGPITVRGKARSSRNSIRHGMTVNEHTVIGPESVEEYDDVRSAFNSQFHPTLANLHTLKTVRTAEATAGDTFEQAQHHEPQFGTHLQPEIAGTPLSRSV